MARRLAPLAALLLAGCATLDHGTLDEVAVVSDPPGATVVASTGTTCTTPCAVSGPRGEGFSVTIAKPGFVTQTASSNSVRDDAAAAWASELRPSLDILGRAVDLQDGSLYRHEPKAIVVKLAPNP